MPVTPAISQPIRDYPDVDIYAHRGSTLLAPENTQAAFELALGYGADVLEIDVRISRDTQVIVTHDDRVDRTCNARGKVYDTALVKLKGMDAGWHFRDLDGRPYREQGIQLMTLNELLECFPTSRINIDIKDNLEEAAEAVAKCIDTAEAQHRVNVGSFHSKALAHFRQISPNVTTSATQAEVAKLYFGGHWVNSVPYRYLQIPSDYFGLPLSTPLFLHSARQLNVPVIYWTINNVPGMKRLIGRGASGLVTDRVDLACKLLGKVPG